MLNTTTEFDLAADSGTTEADARVYIYREYNAIADNISIDTRYDPVEERFNAENVVSIENPRFNGISYGPLAEAYSSDNPKQAYRYILTQDFDDERDIAYYIPNCPYSNIESADIEVDYGQDYAMNQVEVRYENSRTKSTYYDAELRVYIRAEGGGETQIYTGDMNNNGVTVISLDGTWQEQSVAADPTVDIRYVRVEFYKGTYDHKPRVMYIGGLHMLNVSEDIIDVSVSKSEFNQSTYLPFGQPDGNTCDISLDNTHMAYRFGPDADRNYFLKKQRATIEFGLNTKYGEGSDNFEYVSGGVYYIDSYGYDEENMVANVSGQDFSTVLQDRFCGNYLWVNKSLKYIVHDVLARSGVSPRNVIFDFGVAANDTEGNKRNYTWCTDEQTVWDFLSNLAKSELGTVYYDEEERLVFTDRLAIDNKFTEGVQYNIDDTTNLESINEQFEVIANKVKVQYETLDVNKTKFDSSIVYDAGSVPNFVESEEQLLNQVLWRPGEEQSYLGSAVLAGYLRPNYQNIYLTGDTGIQIGRDSGEVLIGDEFIQYDGRTVQSNGIVRLKITKRDARNTVQGSLPTYKGVNSSYNIHKYVYTDRRRLRRRQVKPPIRRNTNDGYNIYDPSRSNKAKDILHKTRFEKHKQDFNSNYRIYGMRFRFNEIPKTYKQDQRAGMYMNLRPDGTGLFFEISNPKNKGSVVTHKPGNVRAYKTWGALEYEVPMPPNRNAFLNDYTTDVLYEEGKVSGTNDGTFIDLTIIQKEAVGPDIIQWYVNGEYMGQFRTEYSRNHMRSQGYNAGRTRTGNIICQKGVFGAFIRGSTNITIDFIYASNDTSLGPDEISQTKGFYKYFDKGQQSWAVRQANRNNRRDYLVEFGSPVHEVLDLEVDHDTVPNLYARTLNTDDRNIEIVNQSHSPFNSKLLVLNKSRIGVELNSTVYQENGQKLDHQFFIYGVSVIREESDEILTKDAASIRRYGVEEVEMANPWVNSKAQAISLANYIRKFWSQPQQHFTADIFPNPALQVRDRVQLEYLDKGFDGNDVWFVTGVDIEYDGGLSCSVGLKRFEQYPTGEFDYRDDGGINTT